MSQRIGVVAFSGGLDTSFLVPFSRKEYALDKVITVTVNTGGFSAAELAKIAARSKEVGADEHIALDGQRHFYSNIIRFMIYGNVSRDGYPLCVGPERVTQAILALEIAKERKASFLFHGSTGAGNDQYRFDLAGYALSSEGLQMVAPVRDLGLTRQYETDYLKGLGVNVEEKNTAYSYNVGLWGVTIGGKETHDSTVVLPEEAWYSQIDSGAREKKLVISFEKGELCGLKVDGEQLSDPIEIIRRIGIEGSRFGIGRHYHIGTSIPGKKARLGYESPAADIIYEAHRTLEKLTLTQLQITGKKPLAEEFGRLIHEARYLDPYIENLRAFLVSTQERVTGEATVMLAPGYIQAVTADSEYSLLRAKDVIYGEMSSYYTGDEARGAVKLHCLEQVLSHRMSK